MGDIVEMLKEYKDACELIRETEAELEERLSRQPDVVHDIVTGSMKEFPYTKKHIHIEGIDQRHESQMSKEVKLLYERKKKAMNIKQSVESLLNEMPARIQRIVKMRYFDNLSWEEIAIRIGRNATADSIRMEWKRYIKFKKNI